MNLNEILASMGGVEQLSKQLGMSEQDTLKGAEALLPGLMQAFQGQAANIGQNGLAGLGDLLGKVDMSSILGSVLGGQNPGAQPGQAPGMDLSAAGNKILGQILGSKDGSRALATEAAQQSGLDVAQLKSMLPMLASMLAGFFAKNGGAGLDLGKIVTDQIGKALGNNLGGALGGILGKFLK
jgi:hypothetical protein